LAKPTSDGALFAYRLKVERPDRTYLFGGEGLTAEMTSSFALLFKVDDAGDPITFGKRTLGAAPIDAPLGALEPGETAVVALDRLQGVYAECAGGHAFVDCAVVKLPN
jgi:hypothetical protein